MATAKRRTRKDEADADPRPRTGRQILAALIAAVVLVGVTATATAIVVSALNGGPTPSVSDPAGQDGGVSDEALERARAAGYKEGVRDTRQQAKEQLEARYRQGYAKGYAEGREEVVDSAGSSGGFQDGYNTGVKAAEEAYKKIIQQAQRIIAEANQAPAATAPEVQP
ncbi:MAG: hypothetical protein RL190_1659 [Actinomycetota bacterium]|jgi:hypothetical protein